MPEDQSASSAEDQLRGRYSVPLPVIRPIPARALVAGVSAIAFCLSLFGFYAEYGRKELVPAQVAPRGGEARVNSTDSASVRRVLVRPGQLIQAGAPLVEVSTDQTSSTGSVADASRAALQQRIDAVRGELELSEQDSSIRKAGLEAQLSIARRSQQQAEAEVGYREEVVQRLKADLARRAPLAAQGAVSDATLNDLQVQLAAAQANVLGSGRELSALRGQVSQLTGELQALGLRTPLLKAGQQKELALLEEEATRLAVVTSRRLTSPIDGVVAALPVSEGASLTPGQLVAVVVPKDAPAEIALLIPTTSVGAVKVGLPVNFRLDAYPYETYGYVEAVIRSVDSIPSTSSRDGIPLVRAYAQISRIPARVSLQPGMSGVAAVEVERRTILAWVLWPLLKNFLG